MTSHDPAVARALDVDVPPVEIPVHAPSLTSRARPVVVLALFEHGRPLRSLLRAGAFARLLGGDLHVLRVVPDRTRVNTLFPQYNTIDAVRAMSRAAEVARATRRWVRALTGRSAKDVKVQRGDFVDVVTAYAREQDAALVVVPPRGMVGALVTTLANLSGIPVLVARAPGKGETILAATDLQHANTPVLAEAAALGRRLAAPLVAVHNVTPVVVGAGREDSLLSGWVFERRMAATRTDELDRATRELSPHAHTVVRQDPDTAAAILAEARERDADLVVVGARKRTWFGRLFGGGVASRVVDRARRSVLVTPLDPQPA